MNLLIQKTNDKTSNVVKLEMLSTEFSSVTKLIKENEIPVIVFTDTNESFLINNINELINNGRNNSEVFFNILEEDLISLGGNPTPVDSRPYKVYTALLTQSGTDAPVATVLENTLGEITFTYEDVGSYGVISDNLFNLDKTSSEIISTYIDVSMGIAFISSNRLKLFVAEISDPVILQNDQLNSAKIEIRVYN